MFGNDYWKNLAQSSLQGAAGGLLGSAFQFLSGGIGNFFDNIAEQRSIGRQVAAQKELTDYNFEKQMEFWNEQNRYNAPTAQMSRLREAGLNPAMLNGNAVNNQAGGLSSVGSSAPSGPGRNSPQAPQLGMLAQIAQSMAQTGFIEEETRLVTQKILSEILEQNIKHIGELMGLTEWEMKQIDQEAMFEAYYGRGLDGGEPRIKNNPYTTQIEEARQRIRESQSQEAYNKSLTETADTMRPLLAEAEKANTAYTKARIANTIANTSLIPFMQKEIESRIGLNDSQSSLNNMNRNKVEEELIQLLDSRDFNLMIKEAGANEAKAKAAIEAAKAHVREVTLENVSGGTNVLDAITSTVDAFIWHLIND